MFEIPFSDQVHEIIILIRKIIQLEYKRLD